MHEKALSNHVVQTYLMEEVEQLIYNNEQLDEWQALSKELGIKENTSVDNKSPVPFMVMNQTTIETFKELCPTSTEFKKYSQMPIPLEILRLIKMGLSEQHFQKVEIWYDEKDADPVAVGYSGYWHGYDNSGKWENIKEGEKQLECNTEEEFITRAKELGFEKVSTSFSTTSRYLIGRWGDVKAELQELKDKAKDRYIKRKGSELHIQITDAQNELAKLAEEAQLKFL